MSNIETINVVPYNPLWPSIFQEEAQRIQLALGPNCIQIHHIGSTAVKGLHAKPIIDMIPVVKNILDVDAREAQMTALGYSAKGEHDILFRRFFTKPGFNVHVFEQNSTEIDRHLKFRNWIRENPDDRKRYEVLKLKLAQLFSHDRLHYTLGKEHFIADIQVKSGWHGTRVVLALTPHEWQAYHQIRTPNAENLEHLSNDGPHLHFVLYHGIHIVGAAHIELLPNNTAQLHFLGGSQDDHQKRFSKMLFQILQHWLQQRHISILKSSFPVDRSAPYKTSD
ncbi:MAG: GrpB family protein [Candidatus Nucleicultricaceae bacterium]